MSATNPMTIPYKEGRKIMPDKESVFALREEGALDYLLNATTDKSAHNMLMNHLSGEVYVVKKKEEYLFIRHRESIKIEQRPRFIDLSTRNDFIEILAKANGVKIESAKKAYEFARGDYDIATRLLEEMQGYAVERKRPSEGATRPGEKVEFCMRESRDLIQEWADAEVIADNILESTSAKDAFGEEDLEEAVLVLSEG